MLRNITQEERLLMQQKSKDSREAKKLAAQNLKTEWADIQHWRELASQANIRLPIQYAPASELKHLRKALKRLSIDPAEWCNVQGYKTLKGFARDNPEANAVLEVGLLLEYWRENS